MAEPHAIDLESSDIFSLGGSFIPQGSSKTQNNEYATMIKANGDWQKWSDTFNSIDNISATYKYSGEADLGADLPHIGHVSNGYLITELSISTVYNDYPTITVTGHNHAGESDHVDGMVEFSVPADIIAILTGDYGAYDFTDKYDIDDVCTADSTYTLSMEHIDAACGDGNHWTGANLRGKEAMSVNFIGVIPDYPATIDGWTVTSTVISDSNSEFDKSSISAERIVAREA